MSDTTEYPACTDCGQPMRPHDAKAKDHPGTVARQNKTNCQSCAQRNRRTAESEYRRRGHPARIDDNLIPDLTPGFRAYLARRRRLGVPAEGIAA
jgi:hypothetical protein